jgi:hypothetical protein
MISFLSGDCDILHSKNKNTVELEGNSEQRTAANLGVGGEGVICG